jgi:hypothetical protein
MPFQYSLEMMSLYRRHIRNIVREDAKLFVRRLLPSSSPAGAARYITEGDKALGAFMLLMKAKLVRAHAEKLVEQLNAAPQRVKEILRLHPADQRGRVISSRRSGHLRGGVEELLPAVLNRKESFHHESFTAAISALSGGDAAQALSCLRSLQELPHVSPLVSALEGLAQYCLVAETPGVFSPIQPILEAMTKLKASRTPPDNSALRFIVSYLRGAGLSVIPEIFDTHEEAADDLKAVADARVGANEGIGTRQLQELKHKALFHLARMLMDDEDMQAAREELVLLRERAGKTFYGAWASEKLNQLDRDEGSPNRRWRA